MRSRIGIALLSLSCLAGGAAGWAAEPKQDKPAGAPAMGAAEMEAMMKAATPGDQHKMLARMVGDWTFTQKFWMAPGQPPGESSGT